MTTAIPACTRTLFCIEPKHAHIYSIYAHGLASVCAQESPLHSFPGQIARTHISPRGEKEPGLTVLALQVIA